MWPPSSGSSGMKLNRPMKKLKPGDQAEQADQLVLEREALRGGRLAGDPPAADDADGAVRGAVLDADDRLAHAPDLDRQRRQGDGGLLREAAHLLDGVEDAAGRVGDDRGDAEEPDRGQLLRVVRVGRPGLDERVGVEGEGLARAVDDDRRRPSALPRIRSCIWSQLWTGRAVERHEPVTGLQARLGRGADRVGRPCRRGPPRRPGRCRPRRRRPWCGAPRRRGCRTSRTGRRR